MAASPGRPKMWNNGLKAAEIHVSNPVYCIKKTANETSVVSLTIQMMVRMARGVAIETIRFSRGKSACMVGWVVGTKVHFLARIAMFLVDQRTKNPSNPKELEGVVEK